jgi:hypothetical protein
MSVLHTAAELYCILARPVLYTATGVYVYWTGLLVILLQDCIVYWPDLYYTYSATGLYFILAWHVFILPHWPGLY